MSSELERYASQLKYQAQKSEFFDLDTAEQAATLCRKLLEALPAGLSQEQHRLTQLAINYFVLEEDAEDDNYSLIGFDDDLQVVVAVIEELGFNHLLEGGSPDG